MKREVLVWLEFYIGCFVVVVVFCVVFLLVSGLVFLVIVLGLFAFLVCGGIRIEFRLGWIVSFEKKNENFYL